MVCRTVCLALALLMRVGVARLPATPLPDGWSDADVRAAVPYDEVAGRPALLAVLPVCGRTLWRHGRVRRRAHRSLAGLPDTEAAVLPDDAPYAYAPAGGRRDRAVVTTTLVACPEPAERRALFAHERAHPGAGHHRLLPGVRPAARLPATSAYGRVVHGGAVVGAAVAATASANSAVTMALILYAATPLCPS